MQVEHDQFLTPVWAFKCRHRLLLVLNRWSHSVHPNGFSPVCFLRCITNPPLEKKNRKKCPLKINKVYNWVELFSPAVFKDSKFQCWKWTHLKGILIFCDETTKIGHNFRKQSASKTVNNKSCCPIIQYSKQISLNWFLIPTLKCMSLYQLN